MICHYCMGNGEFSVVKHWMWKNKGRDRVKHCGVPIEPFGLTLCRPIWGGTRKNGAQTAPESKRQESIVRDVLARDDGVTWSDHVVNNDGAFSRERRVNSLLEDQVDFHYSVPAKSRRLVDLVRFSRIEHISNQNSVVHLNFRAENRWLAFHRHEMRWRQSERSLRLGRQSHKLSFRARRPVQERDHFTVDHVATRVHRCYSFS